MKLIAFFILLFSSFTTASTTPLSGKFSNVKNSFTGGMNPTLRDKVNLIVTVNDEGQQFFIQCMKNNQLGFGVSSIINPPTRVVTIKAGPECPEQDLVIELDYNEAIIRTDNGWLYLPRSDIHVPVN